MNGWTNMSTVKFKFSDRLLLSIDRRQSVSEAYDTLKLAHSYSTLSDGVQGRVVGIDLSGDPKVTSVTLYC